MNTRLNREQFHPFNDDVMQRVTDLRNQLQDIRFEARMGFLDHAKLSMQKALELDAAQYAAIDTYQGNPTYYPFDHYVDISLPSEKLAQEGLEFRKTAGFRLVEGIDVNNKPFGETMQVRFVLPPNLDFDDNTDSFAIASWLDGLNEAYVIYENPEINGSSCRMYRISQEGLQEYIPYGENEEELEIEFQYLLEAANSSRLEFMEAENVLDFYARLAKMKFYPFSSTLSK